MKALRIYGPLVLVVVAALVGYTWFKTGEIGLWPKAAPRTQYDEKLEALVKERKKIEKQIAGEKEKRAMSLPGYAYDESDQKLAEWNRRIEELDVKIRNLERLRDAEREERRRGSGP